MFKHYSKSVTTITLHVFVLYYIGRIKYWLYLNSFVKYDSDMLILE